MRNETITVHLGIYGKTAAKTIKLCFANMKEHIEWREKDAVKLSRYFMGAMTQVQTDSTGEVLLLVNKTNVVGAAAKYHENEIAHSAYSKGIDIAYIKQWIASDLVRLAGNRQLHEIFQLHPASKTSQTSRCWEVLATADALTGYTSERIDAKYGAGIGAKVVGSATDPVMVEVNDVIIEETKRIKAEFKQKQRDMQLKLQMDIHNLRKAYRLNVAGLGKQERAAITAMKKEMKSF